jgi:hypothetical protein
MIIPQKPILLSEIAQKSLKSVYSTVDEYVLVGKQIAMLQHGFNEHGRVVESQKIFSQSTTLQGPFHVLRFSQHEYLLDVVGDLYRVEEKSIAKIGHVDGWPEKTNPDASRHYVLLYDVKTDNSCLLIANNDHLTPATIKTEDVAIKPLPAASAVEKGIMDVMKTMSPIKP